MTDIINDNVPKVMIGGRQFYETKVKSKKSKEFDSKATASPPPPPPPVVEDDNDSILNLLSNRCLTYDNADSLLDKINKRLEFGRRKYGHGIIIEDDTTKYSNDWDTCSGDNWLMMAYEEMLDGCVYFAAEILRAKKQELPKSYITKIEKALKYCIKSADHLIDASDSLT